MKFITGFRIRIHFLRIRIRIQRIRMEASTDPTDPDPIRIQGFNDQKLKKNNSWKKKKNFLWSKTAIYLSLGLHKVCPGYRRSLQLTKEAIQHFKTWIFSTFVGHFCPPGSGSVFKLRIRIQCSDWIRIQYGSGYGSGSETLIYKPFSIFLGHFCPPGSGSRDPIGSGSNVPSLWNNLKNLMVKSKNTIGNI